MLMLHKHQTETTNDRIECLVRQIKLLSIHHPRRNVGKALLLCQMCSFFEHLRRNIGSQHCACWPHLSRGIQALVASSSGNIENMVARLEFCCLQHETRRLSKEALTQLRLLCPLRSLL